MSFKDKPLKKIVSDKRVTIDAIHNNIINDFKKEKDKNLKNLHDLEKLESKYKEDPSDKLNNDIYNLKKERKKYNNYNKSDELNYYLNSSDILNNYYSKKNNINENTINVVDIMNFKNTEKKKEKYH